jgi:hypothetical protein
MNTLLCRVCGYANQNPPWGHDQLTPDFEICPCCGVTAGYEDCSAESAAMYRTKWLSKGAPWFTSKQRPDDWSVKQQLLSIQVTPCED